MKKLNLSKKLGIIDFSKSFVFSFDYYPREDEGIDSTDFELKLILGENAIKISNVLPSKIYTSKASNEYIIRKVRKNSNKTSFLGDELHIINDKVYKTIEGKNCIPLSEYELIKDERGYLVKRNNPKNDCGQYIRPAEIKLFENDLIVQGSQEYFYSEDSPFDTNKAKTFQFVVSNNGQTITINGKNDGNFKKIKTLSFSRGIERGEIALEIDNKMDLRNLQFSFLKSDIK